MVAKTPSETDASRKAFILGLDGVPWYLIEEWTDDGHLPNFDRILQEGAFGPLRSTTPAATPLAWPSIATGVWPDKHGIYGFQKLTEEYTHRMYTNADLRQPPLWEIVSPATVCNVPMTYPATDFDGLQVSGVMAPEMNDKYTSPSTLKDEIRAEVPGHEISLRWGDYVGDERAFVEDITSLVESRRRLLEFLRERSDDWQLFFFTLMAPDRLQHLVWDTDVLREHYEKLDEIVGDALNIASERNANLFIVSDHGFGPVSKNVCVNQLLESDGYLNRQQNGTRSLLSQAGITKSRLRNALEAVGIDEHALIKKYLPQPVVDALASNVPGTHNVYDLDTERTQAIVHEFGNVYVNDTERFTSGTVAPNDVDSLKRELKILFESCTDPETGEQLLEVYDGDTLFPTDPQSPDLVLEAIPGYEVSTELTSTLLDEPQADAAHRKDGIFLAWGPDVRADASLTNLSVVDVAPTVLHSLGKPIPSDADGRVLEELFRPGTSPSESAIATQNYTRSGETTDSPEDDGSDAEDDMDAVKERLQGLGYMEE